MSDPVCYVTKDFDIAVEFAGQASYTGMRKSADRAEFLYGKGPGGYSEGYRFKMNISSSRSGFGRQGEFYNSKGVEDDWDPEDADYIKGYTISDAMARYLCSETIVW